MFGKLTICTVLMLAATACSRDQGTEPAATIGGSGGAQPVSQYRCGDTKLDVQLLGESASISVDGAAPVELAQQASTSDRTVFSNGVQTLTIEAGKLSWGPSGTPTGCVGG